MSANAIAANLNPADVLRSIVIDALAAGLVAGGALDDVAPPTPGEWDDAAITAISSVVCKGPWAAIGNVTADDIGQACAAARDEVTRGEYDGATAAIEQVLTGGRAADHVDDLRAATFLAWVLSLIPDDAPL
ncbi:MAG: hypothetical protein AB7N73_12205 [Gemmatimonadales bacterium]|jgi:hypothetical protein